MDGRNARSERTKAAIVEATGAAMRAGIFRPSVVEVSRAAGCSVRSVFQHFGSAEALYRVALAHVDTSAAVWDQIVPEGAPIDPARVVMAAVYGRIIPE